MGSKKSASRALRIGVIQNGTLIEERIVDGQASVSLGRDFGNTISLAEPALPKSLRLIKSSRGKTRLTVPPECSGRLMMSGRAAALESLGAVARGDGLRRVELPEDARGKLVFGDTTILFHFVQPAARRPAPVLPLSMRSGVLGFLRNATQLSPAFGGFLALSFIFQVGFVAYLVIAVPPPPRPVGVADLPDEIRMLLRDAPQEVAVEVVEQPDDPVVPDELVDATAPEPEDNPEPPDREETREPEERPRQAAADPAETQLGMATRVRDRTILGGIASSPDGIGDPIGDVLNLSDRNVADVMRRVHAGSGDSALASRSFGVADPQAGELVDVASPTIDGPTVVDRARPTENTDRQRVRVPARIRERPLETPSTVDAAYEDYLSEIISERTRHLEACYQQRLRDDPSEAGRIVLRLSIGTDGLVESARLHRNELDETFERCVVRRVRRWRFEPPAETVRISKSYFFEPGRE